MISVPVQSALSSQCKTCSLLHGVLLEVQRHPEDWIFPRKLFQSATTPEANPDRDWTEVD